MQRFKPLFSNDEHTGTVANIQTCLRLNDLHEIGDATHYLTFRMMGLFSFREWTMQQAVDFWLGFLDQIGLPPDHVTIHPDKLDDWSPLYRGRFPIVPDPECRWSDGEIEGYCTEFYVRGVEIGNIVNPLGTCVDVGFGLERIANLLEDAPIPSVPEVLEDAVSTIIASGYRPGGKEQGYVLRKLLRLLHRRGGSLAHPYMDDEIGRLEAAQGRYERLRGRHGDKSPEWWWDTHGIAVDEMPQ